MPTVDSLVALIKKWPLNSTTLFTATHSKSRKAVDGTDTPVATCIINKWTAKINEKEIYNGKCPPRGREEERKRKKGGRRLQFLPPLKAFAAKHQRTEEKKNQSSDKARGYTFTLPPNDSIIPSPYDHVRLLEFSLKPSSWSHFLYQIYYIGPVGFGLICANSKEPPKSGPYITQWDEPNIRISYFLNLIRFQIRPIHYISDS